MAVRFILTGYVEQAMTHAVYDKLEDGTYAGRIPPCKGVIAFGSTLRECENELRSTLEDWVLVGLELGQALPVGVRLWPMEVNCMATEALGRYIVADPAICHGYPTFRGTRILVSDVLEQVANGMAWEAIIEDWHGHLTKRAIAEAVRLARETMVTHARELVLKPVGV